MTVEGWSGSTGKVKCVWFVGSHLNRAEFSPDILQKVLA